MLLSRQPDLLEEAQRRREYWKAIRKNSEGIDLTELL